MVAHLLATAALWIRIQTSPKHKQWSGQHTLARQKIYKKSLLQVTSHVIPSQSNKNLSNPFCIFPKLRKNIGFWCVKRLPGPAPSLLEDSSTASLNRAVSSSLHTCTVQPCRERVAEISRISTRIRIRFVSGSDQFT